MSTPTYRISIDGHQGDFPQGSAIGPTFWSSREMGRPTPANLETVLRDYRASTLPGGTNEHLGETPLPKSARVIRQDDGKVMAEWVNTGTTYKAEQIRVCLRDLGKALVERDAYGVVDAIYRARISGATQRQVDTIKKRWSRS